MSGGDPEDRREIIIVKRGGGDDDHGHHGGVWKIAFADFMTALMCFFLVMWLVNAANEKTKASIASYFNPMTLSDATPGSRGLDDPGENSPSPEEQTEAQKATENPSSNRDSRSAPADHANSSEQAEARQASDEHLFADPYAVLAEIAAQTAMLQNISARGDGGAQTSGPATGAQGGESYRDPFAPDFWSREVASPEKDELDAFRQPGEDDATDEPEARTPEAAGETGEETVAETAPRTQAEQRPAAAQDVWPTEAEPATPAPQAERLAEQIRDEIDEAFGRDSQLNQTISVEVRDDGILISVTDELNYGMFEIGSAVPSGELVLAMERIGRALGEHAGGIRIGGHTDARPFRSASYDNWRLSSARAQAAYYMLVRAGVEEARVRQVAGFADRALKNAENPLADVNRRIEILLETGG